MDIIYAVITKVPKYDGTSTALEAMRLEPFVDVRRVYPLADHEDISDDIGALVAFSAVDRPETVVRMEYDGRLNLRYMYIPEFYVGEILVLGKKSGREIWGRTRRPKEWEVEFEEFTSIRKAIQRVKQLKEE